MSDNEKPVECGYCGEEAALAISRFGFYWTCRGCDASVGCHKGTRKPLGTLAKPELRQLRRTAHAAFDRLWRGGEMTRKEAYALLASAMGLPSDKAHIAMLDDDQCKSVIEWLTARRDAKETIRDLAGMTECEHIKGALSMAAKASRIARERASRNNTSEAQA